MSSAAIHIHGHISLLHHYHRTQQHIDYTQIFCEVTNSIVMMIFSCIASRQSSIVSCSRQGSVNEELGRYNERVNYQHASTLHLYKDIEEEELIRSTSTTGDQLADHSGKGIDQATENTTTEHDQRTPENNQPSNQDDQSAVLITDQTTTSISESDTAKTLERTPSVEPTDAASPAYQFITWHDVYAYMRSEGVKVS